MNMEISHKITARDLLDLVYCLSGEACVYHGLDEDESGELTLDMFAEFLEEKARNKEVITLLSSN